MEKDLFNDKMDISTDKMLVGIYSREQYLERNYLVLKGILSMKEKVKIKYSKVDLNGDEEKD